MRIPDIILHCAGFFARKSAPDHFLGTGFVVAVQSAAHPTRRYFHVVTAKHVALQLGPDDAIFALTLPDGSREDHHIPAGGWFFHPMEPDRVDVAVTFLFPMSQRSNMPLMAVDTQLFATRDQLAKYEIGLGSQTATIGLFSAFWGTTRLTPLVRMGTLAMMPVDSVPHPVFGSIEVLFVEGTSLNHQSGSPVFALSDHIQDIAARDDPRGILEFRTNLYLLGLNQGHFSNTRSEGASNPSMQVVIVIPSQKILDTLHHPEMAMLRSVLDDPQNVVPYASASSR